MQRTIRHMSKSLYVPLISEEKDKEVDNMIGLIKAKQEAQDKISGYQEAIKLQKANVEVYEDNIKGAAFAIKNGVLHDVPCKMILDWENKIVQIIRKDTWDTVVDREMTEYDKPELTDEYEPDTVLEN